MPPKVAKKSAGGPGTKRGAKSRAAAKAAAAVKAESVDTMEAVDVQPEAVPVVAKEDVKVEPAEEVAAVAEEKTVAEEVATVVEKNAEKTDLVVDDGIGKEDGDYKDPGDEYENGERLDLDDNDPEEYEAEEYGGVDYDEKELVQEDVQEDDELEEEHEEVDGEEDDVSDAGEDELEDAPEELEGEEDEEHATEEHVEMVDAEEEERHDLVKERRKRKEFEIFVGGLDKDATEEDLRKVFREVGEVTEVRLMMSPETKKNKGFAFIRFATVEQAKRACSELKNPVVNGKTCGVKPSEDSDTLFLGNICKSWSKEALIEKLKHYGIETVDDVTLVEDSNNIGMNRGFAFLEFSSRSDALDASKRLQKRDVTFGIERPAKVFLSESYVDPGDEIMAQVKTVFVDGLLASWDEDRMRELLKEYGEIEKIELARNMPSARRKDFGFVTFSSHDAAVTCAKSINNAELGDGESKTKVRARLSRPLQRGRGKPDTRADYRHGRVPFGGFRGPWGRPPPRALPPRGSRRMGGRLPPVPLRGSKRPVGLRDRRPVMALPPRGRPMPPPSRAAYDRRPPVPSYPKSSMKRELDYVRRDELPPRSRPAPGYGPKVASERRSSYRDDYVPRGSSYADMPRGASRTSARRPYPEDSYAQRYERPPPSYREGRPREYESISGSKRPYAVMDDAPPRYAETGVRQTRSRLDYEPGGGASHYGDAYSERLVRSNVGGYSSSRNAISSQDSHGLYSSRQGTSYSGASYGGSEVGGMYPSGYGSDYVPRGVDGSGGSSYSSLYSSRNVSGSSYMGSGGSGSYY